jgi:hypothetical protein
MMSVPCFTPQTYATVTPAIVVAHKDDGKEVGYIGPHQELVKQGYSVIPCDGRPYDPSRYRELGATIGDAYGVADNGWPRLPDLRVGKPSVKAPARP